MIILLGKSALNVPKQSVPLTPDAVFNGEKQGNVFLTL